MTGRLVVGPTPIGNLEDVTLRVLSALREADVGACEDQFPNAVRLGCVGTWSLHPVQINIAKRVFSPSAQDVAHARRVIAAMGDGTGAVMLDGKMEDDASAKQCQVIVELADRVSAGLILIGNRGIGSAKRFVLGNVPSKVVHHSPCSTYVVHTG